MFGLLNKVLNGNSGCSYENLSVAQAKDAIANLKSSKTKHVILDVRGPDEFRSGYIDGSRNIPVSDLATRLSELSEHKADPVIVYCRSGGRSSVASQILAANGFANVTNVAGGMLDWQGAGYPVTRG
jgi:rhodanese-related sulfurtransferase